MSPPNGAGGNLTGLTEGGLSAYPAGLTSGPTPASNGGTPRQTAAHIGLASPSKASQREFAAVRENLLFPPFVLLSVCNLLSFSLVSQASIARTE